MNSQEQAIYKLREALEQAVGKRIRSPKDYDYLSALISNKTKQTISSSTLKRLFSYYENSVTPRRSTLDLLSCFLGYKDFDDFCEFLELNKADMTEDSEPEPELEHKHTQSAQVSSATQQAISETIHAAESPQSTERAPIGRKRRRYTIMFLSFAFLLLIICFAFNFLRAERSQATDTIILKKGQKFASFDEYLSLFGITANTMQWCQPVPYHNGIVLWGPQYNHPEWHNEGDPALLMPTITEYWTPASDALDIYSQRVVDHMRSEAYFLALRLNEVRLTFMRGLTDSTFTFLGVYRMSLEQSDTTHIVYERVGDEVNLSDLDYLQRLRR